MEQVAQLQPSNTELLSQSLPLEMLQNNVIITCKLNMNYVAASLWIYRFGQFISSTLPTFAVCEKFVVMEVNNDEMVDGGKLLNYYRTAQN